MNPSIRTSPDAVVLDDGGDEAAGFFEASCMALLG